MGAAGEWIIPQLASTQHIREGRLFIGCDGKIVNRLDLHPHFSVCAIIRGYFQVRYLFACNCKATHTKWRFPFLGAFITLRLIHIISHDQELRMSQIICEALSSFGRPFRSPRLSKTHISFLNLPFAGESLSPPSTHLTAEQDGQCRRRPKLSRLRRHMVKPMCHWWWYSHLKSVPRSSHRA